MADNCAAIRTVRELLKSQRAMTLATVDGKGTVDATPLFFLATDELTLYWLSSAQSRHSRNLCTHPQVAAAVYSPAERWEDIRGVQLEGIASQVKDACRRSEIIRAYCGRFQLASVLSPVVAQSTLYEFRPRWARLIDNSQVFGYQIEVEL